MASVVCADLGVDKAELDSAPILEMSRTVQRSVAKHAAPLTAYLFGIAVARGLQPAEVAERVTELIRRRHGIDWSD
jgi:hypothetical protein